MPSAKSWSAGESGRSAASGAADASRCVPTGCVWVDVAVPTVSGVMVIYAIISARVEVRAMWL